MGLETLEIFAEATAINRWLYETIKVHLQGDILEIGSGIGNISAFLLSDQSAVYLSDLRQEYCKVLEKKFLVTSIWAEFICWIFRTPISKSTIPHLLEKFDTVIALNVIEHINDDQIAITKCKSSVAKWRQTGHFCSGNARFIQFSGPPSGPYQEVYQNGLKESNGNRPDLNLRSAGILMLQQFPDGGIPEVCLKKKL